MANIRIRLIFDSSNTLVNRLGPSDQTEVQRQLLPGFFKFRNFGRDDKNLLVLSILSLRHNGKSKSEFTGLADMTH